MKFYFLCVLLSVGLASCTKSPQTTTVEMKKQKISYRAPGSTVSLMAGSQKVLNDIENPQIFNSQTCPRYVQGVTDLMYYLPADYFFPKMNAEQEQLKKQGSEILGNIFQIRLGLHKKLQQFSSQNELSSSCLLKIREGFQYARFAEEYLLDWLIKQKVVSFQSGLILENRKPQTFLNPQFGDIELKSGDVLLVRGKSYVSAMIARIGDEEGNFSHLALIGEDSKGQKYVVEALIQYGIVVTPLEKWRQQEDARVALYRFSNATLAKEAGRKMYDTATLSLKKGGIPYDFAMNDNNNYSALFCSEVVRYAYDMASKGKVMIPLYRSSVKKFKGHAYPRSLGVTQDTLFAPYDIEVDPRFELVAEYRYFPLLRQVRMQDAVLQSVYGWMIEKGYSFKPVATHMMKAYFAKIVRQFGIARETLPTYMPLDSIKTNVQFAAVAKALEDNIFKKEKEYLEKKGHLPSFQEMMAMNEQFRREDCLAGASSAFHDFFKSSSLTCD